MVYILGVCKEMHGSLSCMGARRGRYDTDAGIDGRICRSEAGSPWNANREGNIEDVEDGRTREDLGRDRGKN